MNTPSIRSVVLAMGRARCARDDGTAVVEFVILVVLLIVPMVYLILAIMQVQAGSLAATQAVREAGRSFAQADSVRQATLDAKAATGLAVSDQGFEPSAAQLAIGCGSGACLRPGSVVTVTVSMKVKLPFMPEWLARTSVGSIPITATHESPIDVYRTGS